jgi:hypothetical protein
MNAIGYLLRGGLQRLAFEFEATGADVDDHLAPVADLAAYQLAAERGVQLALD